MNLFQAAVLGFIQGATEWLPISSTAHLRIVPALLGWADPGAAFTAVIQWGTFFAAVVYFRKDIVAILTGRAPVFGGAGDSGEGASRKLLLPIVIGTLPVCILGVLLKKHIEGDWRSMYVVAGSMIGFALVLWAAEVLHKARRPLGSVTNGDGLAVGLGQACALIPGASRSGTTIMAGLFAGLERSTAARFSFLLSLPAVFLAGAKELWDARHQLLHGEIGAVVVATIVAFIVGYASIDWFIRFLRKHPTYVFIVYRIVFGAVLIGLTAKGIVPNLPPEDTAKGASARAKAVRAVRLASGEREVKRVRRQ